MLPWQALRHKDYPHFKTRFSRCYMYIKRCVNVCLLHGLHSDIDFGLQESQNILPLPHGPFGQKVIAGLLVPPGKSYTLANWLLVNRSGLSLPRKSGASQTVHTYKRLSWMVVFQTLVGCHDILILAKSFFIYFLFIGNFMKHTYIQSIYICTKGSDSRLGLWWSSPRISY